MSWGVATHFVPQDKIESMKETLIKNVNKESTDCDILKIVNTYADEMAAQEPIKNIEEINAIFKDDSIVDIFERLEKSNSEFAEKLKK